MLRTKSRPTSLVCALIKPMSAEQLRKQMGLNEAQFQAIFFSSRRPAGSEQSARCMPQANSIQDKQPNQYRYAA